MDCKKAEKCYNTGRRVKELKNKLIYIAVFAGALLLGVISFKAFDLASDAFFVLMRPGEQAKLSQFAKEQFKDSRYGLSEELLANTAVVAIRKDFDDFVEIEVCAGPAGEHQVFRDKDLTRCAKARTGNRPTFTDIADATRKAATNIESVVYMTTE